MAYYYKISAHRCASRADDLMGCMKKGRARMNANVKFGRSYVLSDGRTRTKAFAKDRRWTAPEEHVAVAVSRR